MKTLALHILDITENSVAAGASLIEVEILDSLSKNQYQVTIRDNGKGIDKEMLKTVTDPYTTSRTTRKVGLGIPLFKQNAEQTGGGFAIKSEVGKGTEVVATFTHKNIDRPPLGDIAGTIVMLAANDREIEIIYTHKTDTDTFSFDTKDVKEALDGMSLSSPKVINWLKEMINENLTEIKYNN